MNEKSPVGYLNLIAIERKPYVDLQDFSLIDSMSKLNGIIKVKVKVFTPLVFSSGEFYGKNQNIFYPLKRENEKIVIPGSSIKGTLRSYAEALSPSCHLDPPCGEDQNALCVDCSIFGTFGKKFSTMGKVHFNDVFLNPESLKIKNVDMPRQFGGKETKDRVKIYSHIHKENGQKVFSYESLDTNSEFDFEIQFHGMDKKELGLLVLAMGCAKDNSFGVKFGHGKNEGYGSAKINLKELWMMPKDAFSEIEKTDLSNLDEYTKEYLENADKNVLANLDSIKEDWTAVFHE